MKVVSPVGKQLKIEVYGIPESAHRCAGCHYLSKMLNELHLPFTFNEVITRDASGVVFNRPLIVTLAKRMNHPGLNIHYPVTFIDNVLFKSPSEVKAFLIKNNFDI